MSRKDLFRQADSNPVTLGKLASPAKLSVAPNPAQQKTMVTYAYGTDAPSEARFLAVYDMVGRRLLKSPIDKSEGEVEIHFGEWSSGLYQVVLLSGEKVVQTTLLSISR